MTKSDKQYKYQHYLSQFYLKKFEIDKDKSHVWCYDKRNAENSEFIKKKSIGRNFGKNNYYSQFDEEGNRNIELEKELGRLEADVGQIIKKIETNHDSLNEDFFTGDVKGALAFWVGLSFSRVPCFRDSIKDLHKEIVKRALHYTLEDKWPEMAKAYNENERLINVEIKEQASLVGMIKVAGYIAKSILGKSWHFYKISNKHPFITSDNPVIFENGPGCGPAHPFSVVSYPLTSHLVLECRPESSVEISVKLANPKFADNFNKKVIFAAYRYVIASINSQKLKSLVRRYKSSRVGMVIG